MSAVAVPDARGAVTIGSDLSGSIGTISCGAEPCTGVQTALPGRVVQAPTNGVIVRWRVGDGSGAMTLRVIRGAGANFTGVARGATVSVTIPPSPPGQPPAVSTFDTRLPVAAGDYLGVDLAAGASVGYREPAGAQLPVFFPPLGDGETRAPSGTGADEGLVNADLEPDADGDGFGDETQDLCAKDATTQGLCRGPCSNERRGTEGPDTVTGTTAGDNLLALGGDDRVSGLAGDDCLFGGAGKDTMTADEGLDRLNGEAGPDSLNGGAGNDRMDGGADSDSLRGEAGNDRMAGGPARDVLRGGAGNDRMNGTGGNDSLRGEAGNDRITGGAGADKIDVGRGRNRASGGAGRDSIRARNRARDRISCGGGRDKVVADRRDRVARNCENVSLR
jgi:Ca2+-binding RTX toxin-like protein